jgi:hypothetical protein
MSGRLQEIEKEYNELMGLTFDSAEWLIQQVKTLQEQNEKLKPKWVATNNLALKQLQEANDAIYGLNETLRQEQELNKRYEKAIRRSIIYYDELLSEHRDADYVVEDIFKELKKAIK